MKPCVVYTHRYVSVHDCMYMYSMPTTWFTPAHTDELITPARSCTIDSCILPPSWLFGGSNAVSHLLIATIMVVVVARMQCPTCILPPSWLLWWLECSVPLVYCAHPGCCGGSNAVSHLLIATILALWWLECSVPLVYCQPPGPQTQVMSASSVTQFGAKTCNKTMKNTMTRQEIKSLVKVLQQAAKDTTWLTRVGCGYFAKVFKFKRYNGTMHSCTLESQPFSRAYLIYS